MSLRPVTSSSSEEMQHCCMRGNEMKNQTGLDVCGRQRGEESGLLLLVVVVAAAGGGGVAIEELHVAPPASTECKKVWRSLAAQTVCQREPQQDSGRAGGWDASVKLDLELISLWGTRTKQLRKHGEHCNNLQKYIPVTVRSKSNKIGINILVGSFFFFLTKLYIYIYSLNMPCQLLPIYYRHAHNPSDLLHCRLKPEEASGLRVKLYESHYCTAPAGESSRQVVLSIVAKRVDRLKHSVKEQLHCQWVESTRFEVGSQIELRCLYASTHFQFESICLERNIKCKVELRKLAVILSLWGTLKAFAALCRYN